MIRFRWPIYREPKPDPAVRVRHMQLLGSTTDVRLTLWVRGRISHYAHGSLSRMLEGVIDTLAAEDRS